ncbi:MAG: mechanosensitive ion channel family protein [Anaerolineales bacterium]|jgi:small conductance mechanosensitive channel
MNSNLWFSVWRVAIVLLVGLGSMLVWQLILRGMKRRLKESDVNGERLQRLTTLTNAGQSIGHVLIFLIVLLMILHELSINITPILASAGVVGLAFSLGAQTVIKDYLGGILILVEDQFGIGDVISVGQFSGVVERITLRATYLRDIEGKLNLIPNGDIRSVSNLTMQWAQVVVTFNLDYDADLERALHTLEETARLVQSDEKIASAIVETPYALGWNGFTDWAVQMQLIAKTQPGKQWDVARALRKTALELLQKEGIHVAIPRQRIETAS